MKYIIGNWKMNLGIRESVALARGVIRVLRGKEATPEVVICPPFTALSEVSKTLARSRIKLGAQNCGPGKSGAFTGEISPNMLLDAGCTYAVIGHSERRHFFGESNQIVRERLTATLKTKIIPVLCVGEPQSERNTGNEENYVIDQLKSALENQDWPKRQPLLIAYEPVWAIGSKESATIAQILAMHTFVRLMTKKITGFPDQGIKILYGGSVTPDNAYEFLRESEVDGVLVGGASISIRKFEAIVQSAGDVISAQI